MPRNRAGVCLALVGALLGCEPSGMVGEGETANFDTMRALWQAQGIDDYYLEVRVSGAWVAPYTLSFEVRDGRATKVRGSPNAEATSFNESWRNPDVWEHGMVIDSLYARSSRLRENPEWVVTTRFDTRIGLLTFVYLDMPLWADDEQGYVIRRFVRR